MIIDYDDRKIWVQRTIKETSIKIEELNNIFSYLKDELLNNEGMRIDNKEEVLEQIDKVQKEYLVYSELLDNLKLKLN